MSQKTKQGWLLFGLQWTDQFAIKGDLEEAEYRAFLGAVSEAVIDQLGRLWHSDIEDLDCHNVKH